MTIVVNFRHYAQRIVRLHPHVQLLHFFSQHVHRREVPVVTAHYHLPFVERGIIIVVICDANDTIAAWASHDAPAIIIRRAPRAGMRVVVIAVVDIRRGDVARTRMPTCRGDVEIVDVDVNGAMNTAPNDGHRSTPTRRRVPPRGDLDV